MPIRVQNDLPVKEILESENIFVMDEHRAMHQDIRPIKIGLLNLMPLKEETELQILRSLSYRKPTSSPAASPSTIASPHMNQSISLWKRLSSIKFYFNKPEKAGRLPQYKPRLFAFLFYPVYFQPIIAAILSLR